MYYTVYKITNKINGKTYTGMHKTNDLNDGYMGSGKLIKSAIKKYGIENFTKEILHIFDNEQDMKNKEKEVVIVSERTYNMNEGGHGGFGYINAKGYNSGANNVMHNVDVKQRCIESGRQTRQKNPDFYRKVSIQNLSSTWKRNKGKKRPEHSALMKEVSSFNKIWKEDKEGMRDKLSSYFEVISPDGESTITNRLEDFCKERNLSYSTLWTTSKTGIIPKKGKSKGWLCKKI